MAKSISVQGRKLYEFDGRWLARVRRWPKYPVARLRALAVRIARDHARVAPVVVGGRGTRGGDGTLYSYQHGQRIELVRNDQDVPVLLHELAHWLQGERGQVHGPAFVRRYLGLLVRYAGLNEQEIQFAASMMGVRL